MVTFFSLIFWSVADRNREISPASRLRSVLLKVPFGLLPGMLIIILNSVSKSVPDIFFLIVLLFVNLLPGVILTLSIRYLCERFVYSEFLIIVLLGLVFFGSVYLMFLNSFNGPGFVFYDIFLGKVQTGGEVRWIYGLSSDISVFFLNRLIAVFSGIGLIIVLSPGKRKYGVGILTLCIVSSVAFPDAFGFSRGDSSLKKILKAKVRTEHFTINYIPGVFSNKEIEYLKDQFEWEYEKVSKILIVPENYKIEAYLVNNNNFLPGGTGDNLAAFRSSKVHAKKMYLICFRDRNIPHILSLRHEIVHALTLDWSGYTASALPTVEGLAEAIERNYYLGPELHYQAAALLKKGLLPPLDSFYTNIGFLKTATAYAYDLSGSFTGFLMYKYNVGSFSRMAAGYDWHDAYGKSLLELESEWHEFLRECIVSDRNTEFLCKEYNESKKRNFFRRSVKNTQSFKDQDFSELRTKYRRFLKEKQYDEILCMLENRNDTWSIRWKASVLRRMGKQREAIQLIDGNIQREGIDRILLLSLKRNCAIDIEDWGKAIEAEEQFSDDFPDITEKYQKENMWLSILKDEKLRNIFSEALRSDKQEMYRILYDNRDLSPVISFLAANCSLLASQNRITIDFDHPNYGIIFAVSWDDSLGFIPYYELYNSYKSFLEWPGCNSETKALIFLALGRTAYHSGFYNEAEACLNSAFPLFDLPYFKIETTEWLERVKWKRMGK